MQEAISNVEKYIKEQWGIDRLPKSGAGPWPSGYDADTDESEELDSKRANYYQSLVGILHWMVELGHVDMITEMPREGHLNAALHVFSYLKSHC